jgi:hypothetical protein
MFPSAYDGVVHFNLQLLEGITLPNFLAIREEGRSLLNVAYVFSDLHQKVCFRCGQLAHLGQYRRAMVKPMVDQGPVWSFLDVPAHQPQPSPGVSVGPPARRRSPCLHRWSGHPPLLPRGLGWVEGGGWGPGDGGGGSGGEGLAWRQPGASSPG